MALSATVGKCGKTLQLEPARHNHTEHHTHLNAGRWSKESCGGRLHARTVSTECG